MIENLNDKKIYFVVGSFKLGGTERTASRIGLELLERGFNVKFLLINGVFDYDDERLKQNSIVLTKPGSSKLLKLFQLFFRLLWIVWKQRPDYLISFSLGINRLIFFLFYPNTIFRVESNIFHFEKRLYRKYLQDYFSRFPHVNKVIIPSRGLYEASLNYFKAKRKLVQVDNPVNLEEIKISKTESISDFPMLENTNFIVSAGRLHSGKGFAQVIEIYSKTLFPDFKLLILGDGPDKQRLKNMITKLNLEKHVILAGFQANPYRFFSKSKFFVLNSDHESFGNVIIEAMACGVPVISNDCDFGPRHIIEDGYNGILYKKEDVEMFKKSLLKLKEDSDFYFKLKKGAIQSSEIYNTQSVVNQWESSVFKNDI